jgi:hypothetical protein
VPLKKLAEADKNINKEINKMGMSGDSMVDESNTWWHPYNQQFVYNMKQFIKNIIREGLDSNTKIVGDTVKSVAIVDHMLRMIESIFVITAVGMQNNRVMINQLKKMEV